MLLRVWLARGWRLSRCTCDVQVAGGYRPPRPRYASDEAWDLVCQLWHHDPNERPTMAQVRAAGARDPQRVCQSLYANLRRCIHAYVAEGAVRLVEGSRRVIQAC
jgi:hypothetical protein